jgi:hypothetical protein
VGSGFNSHSAENIWLDEANLDFTMHVWPRAHMIVGRQFQSYGMGLLVNNERQSQDGVRLQYGNMWKSGIGFDAFVGGATYTMNNSVALGTSSVGGTPYLNGGDLYESMRLSYKKPDWSIAANWLPNGVGEERGWSADAWARFWGGREVQAEFAEQYNDLMGEQYVTQSNADPTAMMATLDIWKGHHWALKGYASYADAKYNPFYSTVNPYFELYGNEDGTVWVPWERWLDNPIVEPNLQVWGGKLNFDWLKANWVAQYYGLHGRSNNWDNSMWGDPDGDGSRYLLAGHSATGTTSAAPYNALWSIGFKKNVASGVDLHLTYAEQMLADSTKNPISNSGLKDAQLLVGGVSVGV